MSERDVHVHPTWTPGEMSSVTAVIHEPARADALDVDALVVAISEAVKDVALRHGIRPTEFLEAVRAAYRAILAERKP